MNKNILAASALILIFILWVTPGLFGRDPWKADEPYSFGLVYHIVQTGDWVVPTLAGEPFLEKPPLFYLTAAWFGRMFSPPLPLFDATRLAVVFYLFPAFLFFTLSARELYGREYGGIAALMLLGCILLQVNLHKLITDVALFTGFSIALYGFSLGRRRQAGGIWIGTGAGIGFLAKGLLAPGMLGIIALALPALFPIWRRKDYFSALALAAFALLPWLLIWPAALYARSADLFVEFFWRQNFGRFLGFAHAGSKDSHGFYFLNLLWLAWPVIVPAIWSLRQFRSSWREHPLFQVPLVSFLVIIAVLSASSSNRPLYALPMLLPVTLIAVAGVDLLPAKVKVIGNRVSIALFGVIAILVWFSWIAMMTGSPAFIARKLHEFQPDYVPTVDAVLFAVAVLYSALWLYTVIAITRSPDHFMVNWTFGVVLAWGLVMTLWLPALNSGSSYRVAFTSLKQSLPHDYSCITRLDLGESERAMLEYYAGVRTIPSNLPGADNCDLAIEQRSGKASTSSASPEWQRIWEFKHPSIRPKDIFTLYKRSADQGNNREQAVARNIAVTPVSR